MSESVELAKELVEYTKLVGVRNKHIQQVAQELLKNVSGNARKSKIGSKKQHPRCVRC